MFGRRKSAAAGGYEYRVEEVFGRWRGTGHHATKKINRMQKQGWEVVDTASGPIGSLKITFRRPR